MRHYFRQVHNPKFIPKNVEEKGVMCLSRHGCISRMLEGIKSA
jgi:hypothetical protein